jgi:nanoRNase/pAp phosphatase (c-di-AMP/oligoRNAs hydrolase)
MNYLEAEILKKESILLVLPENPKLELLASVLAIGLALKNLQKNVQIVTDDPYKKYPFLSFPKNTSLEIEDAGDVFISIDTKGRRVEELKYEKLENEIRIHLDSESETKNIQKKHVSVKFSKSPFELIVIFGVGGKEELGSFYKENEEIFSETETITINKESYPEFAYDLLSDLKLEITRPIATNLLAAIMAETSGLSSFKEYRSFRLASHLLKMNADYQQIASFFYKNKSQSDIKASRLILKNAHHLKNDIFFSKIPNYELKKSELSSNQIISAIIKQNGLASEKNSLIVFLEPPKEKLSQLGIICIFVSFNKNTLLKFSKLFEAPQTDNNILFSIKATSILEAENKIIEMIK